MKQGWSETEIEALLAETTETTGEVADAECYDSTHAVTFGNAFVVDLMSDVAGPEYLTAHDVRVLLGIPRSDRYGFDAE